MFNIAQKTILEIRPHSLIGVNTWYSNYPLLGQGCHTGALSRLFEAVFIVGISFLVDTIFDIQFAARLKV